jgi:endonuclease/exonuclease/phosphatase family metal-dependent hydrolase
VHRCVGTDGREDVERVGAVIRELDADMVGLQEVASRSDGVPDQLSQLARASGLHAVAGHLANASTARCCNALLCRTSPDRMRLVDLAVAGREPRGAIDAELDVDGIRCRFVVTHLGLRIRERRVQLNTLLAAIDAVPDATLTVILGDLNEWLRPLRSQLLRAGFGGHPVRSFPTSWPVLALDQVLVRPASAAGETRAHVSPLARTASDHLPVRAVLTPLSDATAGTTR